MLTISSERTYSRRLLELNSLAANQDGVPSSHAGALKAIAMIAGRRVGRRRGQLGVSSDPWRSV